MENNYERITEANKSYYDWIENRNKKLGIQCPQCLSYLIQIPGRGSLFCYNCGHFFDHEKDPRQTGDS